MIQKKTKKQEGLTLVELMIAFLIGSVVLAALLSFFFRSSKMIGEQQVEIKDLSQLQFVMNKIISEIKTANTEAPKINSIVNDTTWRTALPHLPYSTTFYDDPTNNGPGSALARITPTYPIAYNFPSQGDLYISDDSEDWWPHTMVTTPESNRLVFYRMKRTVGASGISVSPSEVERIMFYTELSSTPDSHPLRKNLVDLKMKKQWDIVAATDKNFDSTDLTSEVSTIIRGVKYVHFTFPRLTELLDPRSGTLWTQLGGLSPNAYNQNKLMHSYRDTIKITIVMPGRIIGNRLTDGISLNTEVKIRN